MSEFGALFYADWRALVNDVRRVVRSPKRIALWILYGTGIACFFVSRALYPARYGEGGAFTDIARADYLVCTLLVTFALALAFGVGRTGIFRTRAEASFIVGSRVSAHVAIVYLQIREALGRAFGILSSLLYVGALLGPHHIEPLAAMADLAFVVALLSAAVAVNAPRRMASRSWAIACRIVGITIAIAAAVPALLDLTPAFPFSSAAAEICRVLPRLHPGYVLFAPNPLWILAALAVIAAAMAALASSGRDAYPELYALSMAQIDRAGSLATRLGAKKAAVARPPVVVRIPAPPGVMVIVWKSIVEFRRGNLKARSIAAAIWAVLGFALARITAGDTERLVVALTMISVLLFLASMAATTVVADEVRRPLFWLSNATLFERLLALLAAGMWRVIVTFGIIVAAFIAGGGVPLGALVLGIAMPAFVALLTSIGFAVYALVPNAADGPGPAAMLRLFVSIVLLIPVAAIGAVVAIFFGASASFAGMTVFMLVECCALVGTAAWRIEGHIDRLVA